MNGEFQYMRGERRTLTCSNPDCPKPGREFTRVLRSGPLPRFCSSSCNQAVYRREIKAFRLPPEPRKRGPKHRPTRHRLQITLDPDVFLALSQEAWNNHKATATVAAETLQGAVRAWATADATSADQ